MTDQTTPAPPAPVLASIARHGAPKRALWHGTANKPAEPEGRPCTIKRVLNNWHVQVDGQQPWLIGPRTQVWLALMPEPEQQPTRPDEYVRNPWSVVLRLERPTLAAYRHLAESLSFAAAEANDAAVKAADAGKGDTAADLRAVRDTLRSAASAALLGRLSKNPTPCRRCGAACSNCTPPPVPA